jgi:hypothetical protein
VLLIFFQGSYGTPFADVPIINSAGFVGRKRAERFENPVAIDTAPLERQVRAAQAREVNAKGLLATLQSRVLLDTLTKATATRRANALAKQRAVVGELAATVEQLNAAMAVEREETDLIFVLSIMNEV